MDGVGSVLDYATFEYFEQYGDENFGAPAGAMGPSDRYVSMCMFLCVCTYLYYDMCGLSL